MNIVAGSALFFIIIGSVFGIFLLGIGIGYGVTEYKAEKEASKRCAKYKNMLEIAANENLQSSPWLAEQIADILASYDEDTAVHLANKKHPAQKAAEAVRLIARDKRELQKKNKLLQYQLSYYEMLFPWLEEFREVDPKKGWKLTHEIDGKEESEYESIREWLSPDEYQRLSQSERYQLVLDRYIKKAKSNWEIGIDYERYVGYTYEMKGYKVHYSGALLGLEDMGRDLVAEYGDQSLVIQCKRWSSDKTIHEKHIFQLFGTTMVLHIKNPDRYYSGVFITTTTLSDTARKCAQSLHIEVIENYSYQKHPMIKCNKAYTGEKIYHLPMDQQYDRVIIANKPGSLFANTVKEAEKLGYRRAYRWRPTQ